MTLSTPGVTSGAASADPAQAANPVRGVKATGNQSTDGLLEGSAWASPAISFSVPDSPAVYGAGVPEAAQDFQSVSAAQHAVVDDVLTGKTNVPGAPRGEARLGGLLHERNLHRRRHRALRPSCWRRPASRQPPTASIPTASRSLARSGSASPPTTVTPRLAATPTA